MRALLGLVGKKLSHSFSQAYFRDKFGKLGLNDVDYELFELDRIDAIADLIKRNGLVGFNVTVPYKESVLRFLDEIDPVAKAIGAVNAVLVRDGGKLYGVNTDVLGFGELLRNVNIDASTKALVLGSGGSSKAVQFYLRLKNIPVTLVSRAATNDKLAYEEVDEKIIADHHIIINTTPVGMFPDVNAAPEIPYEFITSKHTLIDLVYNPSETLFLQKGKARGATVVNGLMMLFAQADIAWEILWKAEVMKRM